MFVKYLIPFVGLILPTLACEGCSHARDEDVVLTRLRPRMQPDALGAANGPKGPLAWGQLNVLHTTDTHGWLEGHIKEQNYGADWGDFVSFVKHMNQTAINNGVDLLLVDTGDLHDGAGLSDATMPNGNVSNAIFENINYDLLAIGNHELYIADIAYETFNQFSKVYGDRYLTSNVQILNPATNQFEYIGHQYRYFKTRMGLNVMAFGFLYDFTGNSNVSRVIKANDTITQPWFQTAVNHSDVDLFILLGHNPPRTTVSSSTFGTYFNAIRKARPNIPIQIFGGHTHVRDFVVYDSMSTGLESGRYCETLGFFSMTGFTRYNKTGPAGLPHPSQPAIKVNVSSTTVSSTVFLDTATAKPTVSASPSTGAVATMVPSSNYTFHYFRRYLDWNRITFEFHANGSQSGYSSSASSPPGSSTTSGVSTGTATSAVVSSGAATSSKGGASSGLFTSSISTCPVVAITPTPVTVFVTASPSSSATCPVVTVTPPPVTVTVTATAGSHAKRQLAAPDTAANFDTVQGVGITNTIYNDRHLLNLTTLYGCAPKSYCQSCAPFMSSNNIFSLLSDALAEVVYQPARQTVPRIIILNTGTIRFDLFQGPFTYDDSFIVSPFTDSFQFIPNVPIAPAMGLQALLNAGPVYKKREAELQMSDFNFDPLHLMDRDTCVDPPVTHDHLSKRSYAGGRIIRRQATVAATDPGYTTTDDFGTDGDDTIHTPIPFYPQPHYFQANVSFPTDGTNPSTVDVIFLDYFASSVVQYLNQLGYTAATAASVQQYLPKSFTTNSYLPVYAQQNAAWQANVPNCPINVAGNY